MQDKLKRGLVMTVSVGAVLLGGVGVAMADGSDAADTSAETATEGEAVADDTVTTQARKNRGGGIWDYSGGGYLGEYGWSNYLHNTKCHGSSARSGKYFVQDHGRKAKVWARATVQKDGTVKAYWRNTCPK